jgi:hypothetical protein
MISVAVAALRSEGIGDPQAHLYLAVTDNLATLIISRAPFNTADLATLTATVDSLRFTAIMHPGTPPASSVMAAILEARTPETLASLSTTYQLDLTPAYDDRPFFFEQLRISDPRALLNAMSADEGVIRGNFKAVSTLAIIIILSLALVFATILVPSLPSLRTSSCRSLCSARLISCLSVSVSCSWKWDSFSGFLCISVIPSMASLSGSSALLYQPASAVSFRRAYPC